jgi:hypothetical protein
MVVVLLVVEMLLLLEVMVEVLLLEVKALTLQRVGK